MGFDRRADYDWGVLVESDADPDPVAQLRRWLDDAEAAEVPEPNAMVLATVSATGSPSMRNVLLRGITDDGHLEFFTNWKSHKATDMSGNPHVGLSYSWLGLHRQVHVAGVAGRIADARSDSYFASRPREPDRRMGQPTEQRPGRPRRAGPSSRRVRAALRGPRGASPALLGRGCARATEFEFWQGRPNRLHDRLHYWRHGDHWRRERLAP